MLPPGSHRPHQALDEAIPIAQRRVALSSDHERAGADLRHRDSIEDPGRIRPGHVRAGNPRDMATAAELWLRSKHGTWRFFLVTPDSLAGIDRNGKPLVSGQTVG